MVHENLSFSEKNAPPLWLAAKNGFYDVVCKELLEDFMDINQVGGRYDTTPLIAAAIQNRPCIVELLLDSNADITLRDDRGLTASNLATACGHLSIVSILARHGDDVTASPGVASACCKRGRFSPFYGGVGHMNDM